MNKIELKAYKWIKKIFPSEKIYINEKSSPDFILSNGMSFEVKQLFNKSIIIQSDQLKKLKLIKNCKFLIFSSENNEPIKTINVSKIQSGTRKIDSIDIKWDKSPPIFTRITKKEIEKIQSLVDKGEFMNVSDFVRQGIREKLKKINIRKVDLKQAKGEILKYLEKRKGEEIYPDEIMEDLGIELEHVFKVLEDLRKEERIKE